MQAVFSIQKPSCVWSLDSSAVQTSNSSWFWTSWMFPVHVLPAAHYQPPPPPPPFVRHVSYRSPRHKPCAAKVHNIRVIREVIIMRWGWQQDGTVRRVSLLLLPPPPYHSCPFRFRAYQPRQAQKPTTVRMVPSSRARASPASYASAGATRESSSRQTRAAALGSSCLGAMLNCCFFFFREAWVAPAFSVRWRRDFLVRSANGRAALILTLLDAFLFFYFTFSLLKEIHFLYQWHRHKYTVLFFFCFFLPK